MRKLTRIEVKALAQVSDGVDVYSPLLARTLRDVQKRFPLLLAIVSPMHDTAGVLPYFGAKLTAAGKEAVAAKGGAS